MIELQPVSKCKKLNSATGRNVMGNLVVNLNLKIVPGLEDKYGLPTFNEGENHEVYEKNYINRDFEDADYTRHISEQIQIIRIFMFIVGIISILLSRINATLGDDEESGLGTSHKELILVFHSLITVCLVVLMILRHILKRNLADKQLIKFANIQMNFAGIDKEFLLEVCFLCIHPNLLTRGIQVNMKDPIYSLYSSQDLNDIFEICMQMRTYLIFSALIDSSIYLSTRGNRICRIYGTNNSLEFGMKCVFNSSPLISLVVIFSSLLYTFAEMVRLSEKNMPDSDLGQFQNSLWCVMITMGTVGYGDYFPTTYFGRAILFLAAVSGIIISSLLILTLSTDLSMSLS